LENIDETFMKKMLYLFFMQPLSNPLDLMGDKHGGGGRILADTQSKIVLGSHPA
jgi:hypothetical protein